MKPQYVARQSSSKDPFEAFVTQHVAKAACGYLFATRWRRFRNRFTHVAYTSRGAGLRDIPVGLNRKFDRRLRCPRASNWLQFSVLHSQRPLAHVKHRLKSSLLLTQHRSLSSHHTQASTSNLLARQAFAPASSLNLFAEYASITHHIGGATWH
jgi:hypothetical protein